MKLIRFGEKGQEKPGAILKDGSRIDATAGGTPRQCPRVTS